MQKNWLKMWKLCCQVNKNNVWDHCLLWVKYHHQSYWPSTTRQWTRECIFCLQTLTRILFTMLEIIINQIKYFRGLTSRHTYITTRNVWKSISGLMGYSTLKPLSKNWRKRIIFQNYAQPEQLYRLWMQSSKIQQICTTIYGKPNILFFF